METKGQDADSTAQDIEGAFDAGQDAEQEQDVAGGQDTISARDIVAEEDIVAEGELDSEQILERAVLYALEQGAEKLAQSGTLNPFTILIEGEELFIEEQPGESEDASYESARRTVYQMERLCNAYVFCYDGYVDLDDGTSDALVVEYANKGDETAQTIVMMYHLHGDHYHFDETLYQVGEADTLFRNGTEKDGDAVDGVDASASDAVDGADASASASDIAAAATSSSDAAAATAAPDAAPTTLGE